MLDSCGISPLTLSVSRLIVTQLGYAETDLGKSLLTGNYRDYVMGGEKLPSNRDEYLLSEFLSKFPFNIGIDRKNVALEKFLSVEHHLVSNDKLLRRSLRYPKPDSEFHWIFHSAKRKIESCLGSFSWSECETMFGFGPGASIDVSRRVSKGPNKYGKIKPSVTQSCLDAGIAAICSHSVWCDFHTSVSGQRREQWFSIVPGNKIVTVPKNSKTDRVIAIEPLMNMYIQKGIGGAIRSRLHRVGVNLNDQTINQRLCHLGSVSGELATIDLSSASDSISWFLVQELLPPDWVSAIEICRSPRGVLPDGTIITYQKVSSMGNGFTFELESLIFWAFALSVIDYLQLSDRRFSIYGDDIIVPTGAGELLLKTLNWIGFSPNLKKTFLEGPFRESCGKHFFHGVDYSPFYIRENIDQPDKLILLANLISNWASQGPGYGLVRDERLKPVWDLIVSEIPSRYRIFGPLFINGQLNDSSIGASFDLARPFVRRASGQIEGFIYPRLARRIRTRRIDTIGTLICNLDARSPRFIPRASSSFPMEGGWVLKHSTVSQWHELGPWVNLQG